MDQSDESPPVRRRLLPVVAVLALAAALVSLASLRGADPVPSTVDVANQAAGAQLPVELPAVVPVVPEVPAPAPMQPAVAPPQQAPAAQPAAEAPAPMATTQVMIMGMQYRPAAVTINAGDTVTWTNHDSVPHNVVVNSGPERFSSPTLQAGQSFSFTFTRAGSYAYYCSIHPDMRASVTVQQGGTPPPPNQPPPNQPPPNQPPPNGGCVSEQALDAFMAHIKSAHLERSPFQQITDILAIDQYVLTHTVWLETVLQPVFNGSADQVVKDTLAPVMAHIKSAHLERSPFQQVNDILAVDQYVLTHTAWLETVLAPLARQLTC